MSVGYHQFYDEVLSDDWFVVLTEAVADGVLSVANIRDGHRSISLQQLRIRQYGLYDPVRNPRGAASANADAPHTRLGRQDHALDIDPAVIFRFMSWMEHNGVGMTRTVSTEAWHCEADSAAALHAFAERLRAEKETPRARIEKRPLRRGSRGRDVRRVQVYLRRGGYFHGQPAKEIGSFGVALERAVRKFQRDVGLKPDGVVGVKTYTKLYRRYNKEK